MWIRAWFVNLKLKTKFMTILILSLLLVFGGTRLSSKMAYRAYDDALYNKTVQLLTLFSQIVQQELATVANRSYDIIADNVLQVGLTGMHRSEYGSAEWIAAKNDAMTRFEYFSLLSDDISATRLIARDGTTYSRTTRGVPVPVSLIKEHENAAFAVGGREIWVPDPDLPPDPCASFRVS